MKRRRSISLIDRDRMVQEAVETLPGPVAARLLEALMTEPAERVALIRHLYDEPSSRNFAELLIDLEEDRQLALDFAHALKERRQAEEPP